ncbi:MAG: drug/metabolite transporter (DMT)-like permease [Saprospiraceae bacterium]|jgi:drug/metabolite transporter (DMT)-like permease
MNEYQKGLLITLAGVLVITPDSLLIRLIDGNSWNVTFWRSFLSGIIITLGLAIYYRGKFFNRLRDIGFAGLALAFVWTISTLCFVFSIKNTAVANTLFIVSTAPVFAALIAWLVLRERVSMRTWLTILGCLAGIGVIAFGSLEGSGRASLKGDIAALGAAIAIATTFSIARHSRAVSMIPAMAISSFLAAYIAFPFSTPTVLDTTNIVSIAIVGLFVAPLGSSLLAIGPRYIPAADVSLLMLLEALIGPLWVWWYLSEAPNSYTFIGGTLVLITLAISNGILLLRRKVSA